jgi:hypothetical protein
MLDGHQVRQQRLAGGGSERARHTDQHEYRVDDPERRRLGACRQEQQKPGEREPAMTQGYDLLALEAVGDLTCGQGQQQHRQELREAD